jgi:golgi-specific brefeldin A-resistance guanine nucleotide exchange factor 1
MPAQALQYLGRALLSQLPEDPASAIITVKSESVSAVAANGQKRTSEGPLYDPAIVYILELCTILALRDEESITALGRDVAGALQNVLRDGLSYHQTMVSRAVFYTLNLLRASYVRKFSYSLINLTCLGTLISPSTSCSTHNIKLQAGLTG